MKNKYKAVQYTFCIISILILISGFLLTDANDTVVIIGLLTFIAFILLDVYMPQITNLSDDNPKVKTMRKLNRLFMILTVICISVISWLPEIKDLLAKPEGMGVTAIVAVVMAIFGNTAPKIPFNRYMGLRLPWTVRDEDTWKVAHKLLGYITFPIVTILVFGSIVGNSSAIIMYCIIAWVAIPGAYSCWYFYLRLNGTR